MHRPPLAPPSPAGDSYLRINIFSGEEVTVELEYKFNVYKMLAGDRNTIEKIAEKPGAQIYLNTAIIVTAQKVLTVYP